MTRTIRTMLIIIIMQQPGGELNTAGFIAYLVVTAVGLAILYGGWWWLERNEVK